MFLASHCLKIKLHISVFLLISLMFFSCMFFFWPAEVYGQNHAETGNTDKVFSSGEVFIRNLETKDFPQISFYLDFKEESGIRLLNLEKEDFKIVENRTEVKDFVLETAGQINEPVSILLLIDISGSMSGEPIINAKVAAREFISRMRDIDEAAVMGFSTTPELYSDFTSDKILLEESIDNLAAGGGTALFDGIIEGLKLFQEHDISKHKYLIILSDGADTVSRHSLDEAMEQAGLGNAVIYSVALISGDYNPYDIKEIAYKTGGGFLETTDPQQLSKLYGDIFEKIVNQYKITYTSQSPDLENHALMVSISKMGFEDFIETTYVNPLFIEQESFSEQHSFWALANIILPDIWWLKLIVYIFIFLSVTVFIYIISTIMIPGKQDLKKRTDYYLYNITEQTSSAEPDEKKPRFSFFSKHGKKQHGKKGFSDLFEERLKRAGINITGSKFMLIHMISVVVLTFSVFLLTRNFIITFCVVILIIFMPFLFINFKTAQKIKKFNEQLPDTLQLIEGALKAGYSLNQSLVMVVKETKPPISEEFTLALNEIRMGLDERTALENMAKRINSELFNWVILAINIQREVGGNLAEIMDIIANTIREKERVLRQIKSLTAEGKLSAYVLIGLPIILGLVLSVLNRQYISVLFTTKMGFLMLFLAVLLMVGGILWIMKIIKIEY